MGFEPTTFCWQAPRLAANLALEGQITASGRTSHADASGTIRRGLGSETGSLPKRPAEIVVLESPAPLLLVNVLEACAFGL